MRMYFLHCSLGARLLKIKGSYGLPHSVKNILIDELIFRWEFDIVVWATHAQQMTVKFSHGEASSLCFSSVNIDCIYACWWPTVELIQTQISTGHFSCTLSTKCIQLAWMYTQISAWQVSCFFVCFTFERFWFVVSIEVLKDSRNDQPLAFNVSWWPSMYHRAAVKYCTNCLPKSLILCFDQPSSFCSQFII